MGNEKKSPARRSTVRGSGQKHDDKEGEWGAFRRRPTVVGARGRTNRLDKIQDTLAVIIMTSCVGAVGIEDLDRASASERENRHGVYQAGIEFRLSIENSKLRS